jgi:hypothetical protein
MLLCRVASTPVAREISSEMLWFRAASAEVRVAASVLMLFCSVVSAAVRAEASAETAEMRAATSSSMAV